MEYTGNSKALDRWEQCLNYIKENMRPALEVLLSKDTTRDTDRLESFAKNAVHEFIERVKKVNESVLSKEVKKNTVEKLNKITILSKIFAKNFSEQNLKDYYEELNLKGDESLVKSALEIKRFHWKIQNDYKDLFSEGSQSWIDSSSQSDLVSYNTLSDELSNAPRASHKRSESQQIIIV